LVLQTQASNSSISAGQVARYSGFADTISRLMTEQGLAGLWRGNFANCLRYFPAQAFNLATKDRLKAMLPEHDVKTDFWKSACVNVQAAALSGVGTVVLVFPFVYPLDHARMLLAADVGNRKYTGLWSCLTSLTKGQWRSLYCGYQISIGGVTVHRSVQFGCFDTLVSLNPFAKDRGVLGIASTYFAAQVSSIASVVASYPFDTVRRQIQLRGFCPDTFELQRAAEHARLLLRTEGIAGFYKGVMVAALRSVAAAGVLSVYDRARFWYS
jgi:solute carrier family 25 (adenine nucleotide translocator) protein 4/5/6/31